MHTSRSQYIMQRLCGELSGKEIDSITQLRWLSLNCENFHVILDICINLTPQGSRYQHYENLMLHELSWTAETNSSGFCGQRQIVKV